MSKQPELLARYPLDLHAPITSSWQLDLIDNKLSLLDTSNPQLNPFYIDFLATDLQRRKKQFGVKQLLAKAVGYKTNHPLTIIDATAGLGRDSFLLASLGCQVTMIERSAVLAALLEDAFARLRNAQAPEADRLTLIHADSKNYLNTIAFLPHCRAGGTEAKVPDVIYLDPMFPERKKSALVKKNMQILQRLLGHSNDETGLLQCALATAVARVVVKRPKLSGFLANRKPSLQFISKTHRFDVYFNRQDNYAASPSRI